MSGPVNADHADNNFNHQYEGGHDDEMMMLKVMRNTPDY